MSSSRARTVLIVDDSALLRAALRDVVAALDGFEVAGTAADGREAIDAVRALRPDIVTLDVEMPGLDGLSALETIMREAPRPVVMLSGAASENGVDLTLRALELGAVDFVRKDVADAMTERLRTALRAAAATNLAAVRRPTPMWTPAQHRRVAAHAPVVARAAVVMAASTGGPRALAEVVASLPADLDAAVLIVQHMPAGFTAGLARRLAALTTLPVHEAADGAAVHAGHIYLAPGGRHLRVVTDTDGARLVLDDGPTIWGVRPAADPLFVAVAQVFAEASVGVVLTGMGRDGALGLSAIREAGGGAVVQDEASAAVYGMPREALALAGADRVVAPAGVGVAVADLLAARRVPR